MLKQRDKESSFPLFTAVHKICIGELKPEEFIGCLRDHPARGKPVSSFFVKWKLYLKLNLNNSRIWKYNNFMTKMYFFSIKYFKKSYSLTENIYGVALKNQTSKVERCWYEQKYTRDNFCLKCSLKWSKTSHG